MGKKMFTAITDLILKNQAVAQLTLMLMLILGLSANYATLQKVSGFEEAQYNYSYRLVSRSLANISEKDEAIKLVRKWEAEKWGAQLTAINILCNGPGRVKLEDMWGLQGSTDICRVAM